MTRHLVLVGLMAAGKSEIGAALAEHRQMPFLDNDALLEARSGRTGEEIAAADGVTALHAQELEVLRAALACPEAAVVTAAASVVDHPEIDELLASHVVVWLDAPDAALFGRIAAGGHRRPVTAQELAALRSSREATFARLADLRVECTGAPAGVVRTIAGLLPPQAGARPVRR